MPARIPRGSSSPSSSGLFGALKDAVKAGVGYAKPQLVPRDQRVTINRAERDALADLDGDIDERRRRQHRN